MAIKQKVQLTKDHWRTIRAKLYYNIADRYDWMIDDVILWMEEQEEDAPR